MAPIRPPYACASPGALEMQHLALELHTIGRRAEDLGLLRPLVHRTLPNERAVPVLDGDRSHLCIVVLEHQASAEKLRGPYRPSSVDRQPLAKRTTIAWQRYENDPSFSVLAQLPLADKLVHLAGGRMMQYLQRANRDQGQVGAFPDVHVDRQQRHGMRQWKNQSEFGEASLCSPRKTCEDMRKAT